MINLPLLFFVKMYSKSRKDEKQAGTDCFLQFYRAWYL